MVGKNNKTEKDLEILFAWNMFYLKTKNVQGYQKCQEQIAELLPIVRPSTNKKN